MEKTTIDLIEECIEWLDKHKTSNAIGPITQTIDRLAVLSISLGNMVTDASALANELEDNYKASYATIVNAEGGSIAKAEYKAEAELIEAKKEWTSAKNGYKKLNTYLERLDRVIESYRQMVSVIKEEMKKNNYESK